MNIYFGEKLKELRNKRELTQQALADVLGVSFQTISKWENGNTYPDIAILPEIAFYFSVSVDELLGLNRAENEHKISEYLKLYETMHLSKTSEVYTVYQNAVNEFPNDYRILVRYMELMTLEERDFPFIINSENKTDYSENEGSNNPYKHGWKKNPEYEKICFKLSSIYENIQKHCTDDDIRIWSKRIMINHLMKRYDLSFDENTEKWCCDTDALKKAESILSTMPALCDSKDYLAIDVNRDDEKFYEILSSTIEELLYLLQNRIISYHYKFTVEKKIEVLSYMNSLFNMLNISSHISKNTVHLIYNYGRLGYLYAQLGDNENAIRYLKLSVEMAKELDSHPEEAERILRFYETEPYFRDKNMTTRMKELMTSHYPLPENLKSSKEFMEVISLLTNN